MILPAPYSYDTSRAHIYRLHRAEGVQIPAVVGQWEELEEALTTVRGQETKIRFMKNPLSIVVPKLHPDTVAIRDMLQSVQRRDGLIVTLGEHYNHSAEPAYGEVRQPSWLRVDLSKPETPHMIVAGTTGSGKTVVLKNIVLSAAVGCDPATTSMILIDIKAVDGLPGLEGLPHLACPVISDPKVAVEALAIVVEELTRRSAAWKANPHAAHSWPRIVVVVDELSQTIASAGDDFKRHVDRITAIGRGLGVNFIGGTQKPTKDLIGAEAMSNMPVRAVGMVSTKDEGYYATGVPGLQLGAHKLTGKGDFILTIAGNRTWGFQSAHIEQSEEIRIVANIRDKWWAGRRARWTIEARPQIDTRSQIDQVEEKPVEVNVSDAPGLNRSQLNERHTRITMWIRDEKARRGEWPSANRVVQAYRELFDVGLNPNTAKTLLERAKGEA